MKPERLDRIHGPNTRSGILLILLLFFLVLAGGCQRWSIKDRLYPPPDASEVEGILRVGIDRPPEYEYRIGPGDTIMLRFFYYPDMIEPSIEVPSTGTVFLPLVGGVQVLGYSEAELNTFLKERYSSHLMFPDVVARIMGRKHDGVYMDGVVAGLPPIPYDNTLTLLDSLKKSAMANMQGGALNSIIVIRGLNTPQYTSFRVNAKKILAGKENDIYLRPNDIVYVPSKFIRDVNYFVNAYIDNVLGRHIMPATVFPQAYPYKGDLNYQVGIDFLDLQNPNPTP